MVASLVGTGFSGVKQSAGWLVLLAVFGCASGPRGGDQLAELLHELSEGYQRQDAAQIVALYDEDFAMEDPTNRVFVEASMVDGVRVTRAAGAGTRADFEALLASELSRFERIEKAKFVLDEMRETDDGHEVDAWFVLYAVEPGGARYHEESWHRFAIVRREDGLRIAGHRMLRRYEVEGSEIQFVDRTAEVGLDFVHHPHADIGEDTPIVPGNFSGSGASAGDIDGDGYLDLVVGDGHRSRLFHNRGDGTFEDVTETAWDGAIDAVRGAYFLDYDDDGRLDILFTRIKKPLVLLRNLDGARFEDVSQAVASAVPGQSESAAIGDLDGDGDLDIYVVRYGDFDQTSWAYPLYNATDGVPDAVLRNDGGTFTSIEDETLTPPGWGLAVAMADYDDDGDLDIYVVNDFGVNHLLRNEGNFEFTEVTEAAGVADQALGMSAAFGDHDNDGDLDIYVANMHSSARWVFEDASFPLPAIADLLFLRGFVRGEMRKVTRGNSMFENVGAGEFRQVAAERGVERTGWAWGANYLDYDNDGDLDLYVPNGFITGKDPADC